MTIPESQISSDARSLIAIAAGAVVGVGPEIGIKVVLDPGQLPPRSFRQMPAA